MRLSKGDTYWFPFTCEIPEEDGVSTITGDLKFRRRTNKETAQVFSDTGGQDANICRQVVLEWRDLKDVDGVDVPYSKENLEEAIDSPWVAAEIVRTWARSLSSAAKKN